MVIYQVKTIGEKLIEKVKVSFKGIMVNLVINYFVENNINGNVNLVKIINKQLKILNKVFIIYYD